jgi:hypothetical protein
MSDAQPVTEPRAIAIDESRWPIIDITFDGLQTGPDIELFIDAMERLGDATERFAILTEIRSYRPERGHVRRLASWMMGIEDFGDICVAIAMVIPSDSFRFLLSSFFLMASIPRPYVITKDRAEAEAFLEDHLQRAGISIDP